MSGPLLDIQDLHVAFSTRDGMVEAVRGIDLQLAPASTVAGLVPSFDKMDSAIR